MAAFYVVNKGRHQNTSKHIKPSGGLSVPEVEEIAEVEKVRYEEEVHFDEEVASL